MHAHRTLVLALVALLGASSAAPLAAATMRPVAAEDLFHLKFLQDAQISPDGTLVTSTQSVFNGPKDGYDTTILLIDVKDGATIDATRGTQDGGVAWAPDGKSFYFERSAPKSRPQVYRYTIATKRIVQVTHVKNGATGAVPSHDGKRVAFTVVETDPAPPAFIDFAKAGFTPKASQKKSDIRRITDMDFEANGAGYVYDKHPHIWVMNADGSGAHALTSGKYAENGATWSGDDRTIYFGSLRREEPNGGPADIYAIAATGGEMRKLPSTLPANNLAFVARSSPRIWYFAGDVTDPAEFPALFAAGPNGENPQSIVPKNTVSFGDSLLADMKEGGGGCGDLLAGDSKAVVNVDGPGYANLRTLDMTTGALRDLTPAHGEAWACTLSHDGSRVAYLYSDFMTPADVYVADTATGTPRRLTHANDAYLRSVTLSQPQPFTVTDSAGFTVHAWFMPATTGATGAKHPTLLDVHGGPQTQFGDTFFHEFQFWTSLGYNVVFSDPRGSTGFGYPYQEALARNWGDAMFGDVQAVMDAVVRRPEVDPTRLGVLGGSYGGYATLWIVSHTDRYKTAIAERAVSDLQSEVLAADFASENGLGGFYTWGKPWAAGNLMAAQSPLTYVENVHTPLMLLHGDEDTRTPIDQTLQEFTALKIFGRTVTYVAVPGENHDLSRTGSPIHRIERLNLMAGWLKTYLQP